MADFYWTGTASGDVSAGGNYQGGAAPSSNGDNVYAISNPANGMTTGVMPVNLGTLAFGPEYQKNVGNTAGQPTLANVTTLIWAGGGQIARFNSSGTVTTLRANMANGSTVVLGAGTFSAINTTAGRVEIASGVVLTSSTLISTKGTVWVIDGAGGTIAAMRGTGKATVAARTITALDWFSVGSAFTSLTTTVLTAGTFTDCMYYAKGSATDTAITLRGRSALSLAGNPNTSKAITTFTVHAGDGAQFTSSVGSCTLSATPTYIGESQLTPDE